MTLCEFNQYLTVGFGILWFIVKIQDARFERKWNKRIQDGRGNGE